MDKVDLTRHMLATIAYRLHRVAEDAPNRFGDFRISDSTRSPCEIVRHMTHLLIQTRRCFEGIEAAAPSKLGWKEEIERFHETLQLVDADLERNREIDEGLMKKLVQGPISDIMTHVGQLAMIRGRAGLPLEAERFTEADIVIGRVGRDQAGTKEPLE